MSECSCLSCQKACQRIPGWFRPGEAEKAAELLGLTLQDFFNHYLGVRTTFDEHYDNVEILTPATIVMEQPGHRYGLGSHGSCVFFKEGRCRIHEAKPFECSDSMPCDKSTYPDYERKSKITVELWKNSADQITQLLEGAYEG